MRNKLRLLQIDHTAVTAKVSCLQVTIVTTTIDKLNYTVPQQNESINYLSITCNDATVNKKCFDVGGCKLAILLSTSLTLGKALYMS